mmetsp:Transcript_17871/g.49564  ORF Transcript_17871/g.49564 Transcript_17871/m.49564 type:complete len:167 (-) Transcript_17871:358-858(-)
MKPFALFLFNFLIVSASALASIVRAEDLQTGKVHINVHNLRNLNQGKLYVGIFDRDGATNKADRVTLSDMSEAKFHTKVDVKSAAVDVTFDDVPHGEYAAFVFHDLSDNAKLNSNFIGIPTEDICISNNVKGGPMGGPKWETAKFVHDSKKGTKIKAMEMNHIHRG